MGKQNKQSQKQSFVMLCEGQKTEHNYIDLVLFNGFRTNKPLFNKSATGEKALGKRFDFRGPTPLKGAKLLEEGLRQAKADANTMVWCFIDGDNLLKDKILTPERSRRIQERTNLKVCITNPCIEFWFLLHVDKGYTTKQFENCDAVELTKVKGFENYKENAPEEIDLLYDVVSLKKAVKHAQQLQKHHEIITVTHPNVASKNPFTAFHHFIEFLTEQQSTLS